MVESVLKSTEQGGLNDVWWSPSDVSYVVEKAKNRVVLCIVHKGVTVYVIADVLATRQFNII